MAQTVDPSLLFKMTTFKPINKLVLVSFVQGSDTSTGGVAIPEKSQGHPDVGKVEAVADDADPNVKVGDKIQFTEGKGQNFPPDPDRFRLVPSEEILAILS